MSPTPSERPSALTARALVEALVARGVREVVLCPGSRSAPLAYALSAAHDAGWLRLHVRIDERSAGFLALGLARSGAHDRPVAVVTTSGTAVANLHPALLEASHAGRPLLAITADRPHEMRGTGANQTADQVGIFGGAMRWSADVPAAAGTSGPDVQSEEDQARGLAALVTRAVAAAQGLRTGNPGPVHLNIAFRDPLAPARVWKPGAAPAAAVIVEPPCAGPTRALADDGLALLRGPRTVVVAGDGAGPGAREVAEAGGWPLFAEPTSGARAGSKAIAPYRLLLDLPELADRIERVVLLGHPTLSRPVSRLLARRDVEIVVIAAGGAAWTDVAGTAARVCGSVSIAPDLRAPDLRAPEPRAPEPRAPEPRAADVRTAESGMAEVARPAAGGSAAGPAADAAPSAERDWLALWRRADREARAAIDAVLAENRAPGTLTGPEVAREVSTATGPRVLVVGSSMAVRDLDLVAEPSPRTALAADAGAGSRATRCLANRGLAGIDGTVSTAMGVALGSGEPVRALMGDLTFLHDVGGLARGPLEPEADLQVIVLNDDGGGIFATLEHGAPERADTFERVFGTPQGADLGALSAGFGARHRQVSDLAGLRGALAEPIRGRSVVEVRLDRSRLRARNEALRAAVRAAVLGGPLGDGDAALGDHDVDAARGDHDVDAALGDHDVVPDDSQVIPSQH